MIADYPGGLARLDTLLLALLAIALDWIVGDMRFLFRFVPHPVQIVGAMVAALERRLNREWRSPRARRLRGGFVVLLMIVLSGVVGFEIARLSRSVPHGWAIELFFVTVLIAQRSLFDHVRAVGVALKKDGLAAAKTAVRHIVGRDLDHLDDHGVARAAIESCAENFSDGVVAPLFWYVLLGLPGLMVYKAASTMDSMIGHRSSRYRDFGMVAARLDDALNLVPARISGLILCIAAFFTPTANPFRAFTTMIRDAGKHSSPNAGWPEAATAGALNLALAGPRRYGEVRADDPWIGKGRARATYQDIRRALFLYVVGCAVNAVLLGSLALLRNVMVI